MPTHPPTSDLLDDYPDAPVCATAMHLLGRHRVVSGLIRTLRCREDNALLRATLSTPSAGEILVVDGGSSLRTALLGDQIAALAIHNGWAGAIIFGAVRDVVVLDTLAFHIKCQGFNPRKSAKLGAGERDVILHVGEIEFVPGQFLASDPDGIVVLPQSPGLPA